MRRRDFALTNDKQLLVSWNGKTLAFVRFSVEYFSARHSIKPFYLHISVFVFAPNNNNDLLLVSLKNYNNISVPTFVVFTFGSQIMCISVVLLSIIYQPLMKTI